MAGVTMTIYASKTAESMTTDPAPWITRQSFTHTDRYRYAENVNGVLELSPRPKCTPTTTHEANPILVALRWAVENWGDESENGNGPFSFRYHRWLEYVEKQLLGFDYTPAQIDHARRVLTRLASFMKEN